jgi:alkylhydroperoxidase family enzyme
MRLFFTLAAVGVAAAAVFAGEPLTAPRPVPQTRTEIKKLLEDMKQRTPRIPLPALTDEEKAKAAERNEQRGGGGGGGGYEGRLRSLYLNFSDGRSMGAGLGREPDANMTLDYAFKTKLFWIVSRANNCQYCLGHQEWKLSAVGLSENELGALDGDWSEFTPKERAAFAFARKLTHEPNRIVNADVDALRKDFTDLQILEMTFSVAGNNSINRWKEGTGVPQSKQGGNFGSRSEKPLPPEVQDYFKTFITPTPEKYRDMVTKVAPALNSRRPDLEPRADVERMLEECARRKPRLPLVDEAKAREVVGELPKGPVPQWVRLLANFPRDGKSKINGIRVAEEKGELTPTMKAQVSWIIARQDRAWYATGLVKKRLRELGVSEDDIYKLDGDWSNFTPAERSLFTVARHLAASPVVLTDAEVAEALKQTSNRDVVQLINYVTNRAFFDRVTEVAGLALD